MIILGIILLLIGLFTGWIIPILIGLILLVVGAALWIAGATGNSVGGRSHYW